MQKLHTKIRSVLSLLLSSILALSLARDIFAMTTPETLPSIVYAHEYSVLKEAEQEIYSLVNQLRTNPSQFETKAGMPEKGGTQPVSNLYPAAPALQYSNVIADYARYKSIYMLAYDDFGHDYKKGPLAGLSFQKGIFYKGWKSAGENIAQNYQLSNTTGKELGKILFTQWLNSKGHLENMMSASGGDDEKFNTIGIGVVVDPVGKAYGTQQFAKISSLSEHTYGSTIPNPITVDTPAVETPDGTPTPAKKPKAMTISAMPTKAAFDQNGQVVLTGGQVTILFDDGTQETVDMSDKRFALTGKKDAAGATVTVTVSLESEGVPTLSTTALKIPFDSTPATKPEETPTETPDNTPQDKPTDTPAEKTVTSVKIGKYPTKLTYQYNQALDLTGGEVSFTYSDNTTKSVKMYDLPGILVSGYDGQTPGKQTVTLTFEDDTTLKKEWTLSFSVDVAAKATQTSNNQNNTGVPGLGKPVQTGNKTDKTFSYVALAASLGLIILNVEKRLSRTHR